MIAVRHATLDIHGAPRTTQWTEITATAAKGATTIKLPDTDWKVGEEIVIASTSFNPREAERRTITAIRLKAETSQDYAEIDFAEPLEYEHISVEDTLEDG